MAFQSGTATSYTDFFTQLRTFATANAGFANEGTTTINSNTVHHLSKGGIFWSFEETVTLVTTFTFNFARMRMTYTKPTVTFDEATPTGQPRYTCFGTNASTGPFTAHTFYTEGTAVHAVLEVFPGVFQHLSFGSLTKSGAWTGGEYLTAGSYQSTVGSILRFDQSGFNQFPFSDEWGAGHNSGTGTGFTGTCLGFVRYQQSGSNEDDFAPLSLTGAKLNNQQCKMSATHSTVRTDTQLLSALVINSPNQANLRTALFPMYVRLRDYTANTPAALDAYFIAGTVPGVRVCNVSELNAYEIINTDWQTFPTTQKDGDNLVAPISEIVGFAYQRVV